MRRLTIRLIDGKRPAVSRACTTQIYELSRHTTFPAWIKSQRESLRSNQKLPRTADSAE
jgi:hypothetical protein